MADENNRSVDIKRDVREGAIASGNGNVVVNVSINMQKQGDQHNPIIRYENLSELFAIISETNFSEELKKYCKTILPEKFRNSRNIEALEDIIKLLDDIPDNILPTRNFVHKITENIRSCFQISVCHLLTS